MSLKQVRDAKHDEHKNEDGQKERIATQAASLLQLCDNKPSCQQRGNKGIFPILIQSRDNGP